MNSTRSFKIGILLWLMILNFQLMAHPAGNMITVGDHVLWSYISPVEDVNHYACIMSWKPGKTPEVLIRSEFEASDYMLYNNKNEVYIIERRFLQSNQKFKIRVLKFNLGEKPFQIWDWFEDSWRIGESGFFMISEHQMVFGSYPNIYSLVKGEDPVKYFDFRSPVNRIRMVVNDQILILGKDTCWLVNRHGGILKKWDDLLSDVVTNPPLNRNQIFDMDYVNGELLLANWGQRSFDRIDDKGIRKTIIQQKEPLAPHWVAFYGKKKLLFSSELIFDGSTPKPALYLFEEEKDLLTVWKH